jgi:Leucine-rich repeat (LRR) protein
MIVTKNSVLIGNTDSHEDIKKLHNLKDTFPINFVSIEIYPDNGDLTKDPKYWNLHTDLPKNDWPDWYSEKEAEIACRAKILNWIENLKKLDCHNTEITKLPEFPKLEVLCCRNTKIKDFSMIPKSCKIFNSYV